MKTQRTFKPGDYCRFNNEEIPTIIALLKANGWEVNKHIPFNESHDCIIVNKEGGFHSFKLLESIEAKTELSRHDFLVTAIRLNEGDGMRSDVSTPEQRRHISVTLEKLGVNQYVPSSDRQISDYKLCFFLDREEWLSSHLAEGCVINHLDYLEWCKRLNIEPIHIQSEIYENLCRIDSDSIQTTDVGEKVRTQPDIIKDVLNGMDGIGGIPSNESFYAEFDFRCRAALGIEENKSTLTLPDGTTVDLAKPLEVSYGGDKWEDDELEFHFVGLNSAGHIIVECLSDCELHAVDKIRNKPEQEFKGQKLSAQAFMNASILNFEQFDAWWEKQNLKK